MGAIALLLMAAQPAAAQDQLGFDIRCMVASQLASEQVDDEAKSALSLATMFYFGRVDSVISGAALEQRFAAESRNFEGRPLGPMLEQCGRFMEVRGKALEAIGAKLEAAEKARRTQ